MFHIFVFFFHDKVVLVLSFLISRPNFFLMIKLFYFNLFLFLGPGPKHEKTSDYHSDLTQDVIGLLQNIIKPQNIFSILGKSQGLLYKHRRDKFAL